MTSTEAAARLLHRAHVLRAPEAAGAGYWASAPEVFYARNENAFYDEIAGAVERRASEIRGSR